MVTFFAGLVIGVGLVTLVIYYANTRYTTFMGW